MTSYGFNTNAFSNNDLWSQQARKRAEQWAQVNAQGTTSSTAASYQTEPDSLIYGGVQQNTPVQATQQTQASKAKQPDDGSYKCTDGKDDGHIGFFSALGHAVKGGLKFVGRLAGFEWDADGKYKGWSGGTALKNLAIGAAIGTVCVLTAGTAVPALIAGAGVVMTGYAAAKSGYRAFTAKTDAECKAAFDDFGGDLAGLGLSVVGAKAAMKQYNPSGNYSGLKGTWNAIKDSTTLGFKKAGQGIKALWNAGKTGGWESVKTTFTENWNGFTGQVQNNWAKMTKTPTAAESQQAKMDKYKNDIEALEKKISETKNAKTKTKLEAKLKTLKDQRDWAQKHYDNINAETTFEAAQNKIATAEKNVADIQKQIDTAKATSTKGFSKEQLAEHKNKLEGLNNKLTAAKDELNIYKEVVNTKTSQARNIKAEIERLNKEANGENVSVERFAELMDKVEKLEAQQKALNFELPKGEHKVYAENATNAAKKATEAKEAYEQAKADAKAAKVDRTKFNEEMQAYNTAKAEYENATGADRLKAFKALKKAETPQVKEALAKEAYDMATLVNNNVKALSKATSGYDYTGTATTTARNIFNQFNSQYGTLHTPFKGNKVLFTDWTIPGFNYGNVGKGWTIAATGDLTGGFGALTANSKDEVGIDDIFLAEAAGTTPIEIKKLKNAQTEYAAAPQYTQQAAEQYYQQAATQQQATGQQPIDWQAFDYMLKAYGVA